MEKSIGLILIAIYGVWYFVGQNANVLTTDVSNQELRIMQDTTEYKERTQSKMHDTIKTVAKREGWIVTEFKSNALIAEKTSDNDSISVTITFSKSMFSILPKNVNLTSAIDSALKT